MADIKRIAAVAVGPARDHVISAAGGVGNVRPYIDGLIDGLAKHGRRLGTDYEIHYMERPQAELEKAKKSGMFRDSDGGSRDLIFAMSTNVVRAAKDTGDKTPIVSVVSHPQAEGFHRISHITGISARRSQTADKCFEYFFATVPTLKRVRVLHKAGYGPSDRSLKLVRAAAKKRGVAVEVVAIKTREDIEKKLKAMAKRDLKKPAEIGLMALPVDVALGAVQVIVDVAQGQKNIPVFFPITDHVKANAHSPLGGYGVSQRTCGELMADYVDRILWRAAPLKSLKVTEAGDEHFEWLVSSNAATALNIRLPQVV
jgi:ABC-type uncharacterized transport system substrate-binding protein